FDAWVTFSGGQSAYDALGSGTYDPAYSPFNNGNPGTPTPYDSANSLSTYTLATVVTGSVWTGTNSGSWSDSGNWTGGVPNASGATANFGSITSGRYAVALDAAGE